MRFFVPGVPHDEAATTFERMREPCGAPDDRPLYSISYEDEVTEIAETVGEEGVVAIIFADEEFHIFEESGEPRSVPVLSVTEMAYFDEEGVLLSGQPPAAIALAASQHHSARTASLQRRSAGKMGPASHAEEGVRHVR
jgi:hypothetical protein